MAGILNTTITSVAGPPDITSASGGRRPFGSTIALDVEGGSVIINSLGASPTSQLWDLAQFGLTPYYRGAYAIMNHAGVDAGSGFLTVPDLPAGQGSGARVTQEAQQLVDDVVKDTQLWDLIGDHRDGLGPRFMIRSRHSGLVLTIQGKDAGARVVQAPGHKATDQLWYVGSPGSTEG